MAHSLDESPITLDTLFVEDDAILYRANRRQISLTFQKTLASIKRAKSTKDNTTIGSGLEKVEAFLTKLLDDVNKEPDSLATANAQNTLFTRDSKLALEWLQTHHAELVITDLQMPNIHGIDILVAAEMAAFRILLTSRGQTRQEIRMALHDDLTTLNAFENLPDNVNIYQKPNTFPQFIEALTNIVLAKIENFLRARFPAQQTVVTTLMDKIKAEVSTPTPSLRPTSPPTH